MSRTSSPLVVTVALGAGLIVFFLNHWRIALSVLIGAAALALLVANLKAVRHG